MTEKNDPTEDDQVGKKNEPEEGSSLTEPFADQDPFALPPQETPLEWGDITYGRVNQFIEAAGRVSESDVSRKVDAVDPYDLLNKLESFYNHGNIDTDKYNELKDHLEKLKKPFSKRNKR